MVDYIREMAQKENDEILYRAYVTDVIKALSESLGINITRRYYDLVNPTNVVEQNADEIALKVIEKAGLKVK